MAIFRTIKKLFTIESDKSYWDKKATVLEWNRVEGKKLPSDATNAEIYAAARTDGYDLSWKNISKDIPADFIELSKTDITFAIGTGIVAAFSAKHIDSIGSKKSESEVTLEGLFEKITPKNYDKNNAYDFRGGKGHRKVGHDMMGIFHKNIPGVYQLRNREGNLVSVASLIGGHRDHYSQSEIMDAFYANSANGALGNLTSLVSHTFVHLIKDMVTPNGIPLPFSSFFNKFEVAENVSGYSVKNSLLDNIQSEFNTLRASDFTTITFIDAIHRAYYQMKKKEWNQFDKENVKMTKAEMKIFTYSACILAQMSLYLFQKNDISSKNDRGTNETDGGTFNWPMFLLVIKNALVVSTCQKKTNELLLKSQFELIQSIKKEKFLMGQHYSYADRKYDYYYDNDDNDYLLPEEIKLIIQLAPPVTEQDKDSIDQIQELELLKYRAGIKELTHKEFMERQIEILNRYNEK